MATNKPEVTKSEKPKRVIPPLAQRIDSQVTKAVLAEKMTHEELKKLADRLARLHAFMTSEM